MRSRTSFPTLAQAEGWILGVGRSGGERSGLRKAARLQSRSARGSQAAILKASCWSPGRAVVLPEATPRNEARCLLLADFVAEAQKCRAKKSSQKDKTSRNRRLI